MSNLVIGTEGNDFLVGTGDEDFISGLGGDDFIAGLRDEDTLVGGEGADTFSLEFSDENPFDPDAGNQPRRELKEFGNDVITDFDASEDKIALDADIFSGDFFTEIETDADGNLLPGEFVSTDNLKDASKIARMAGSDPSSPSLFFVENDTRTPGAEANSALYYAVTNPAGEVRLERIAIFGEDSNLDDFGSEDFEII
ncbi:MAG: hypothetical protein ACFBSC_19975 [Microcoleaceae cyanobacterium]